MRLLIILILFVTWTVCQDDTKLIEVKIWNGRLLLVRRRSLIQVQKPSLKLWLFRLTFFRKIQQQFAPGEQSARQLLTLRTWRSWHTKRHFCHICSAQESVWNENGSTSCRRNPQPRWSFFSSWASFLLSSLSWRHWCSWPSSWPRHWFSGERTAAFTINSIWISRFRNGWIRWNRGWTRTNHPRIVRRYCFPTRLTQVVHVSSNNPRSKNETSYRRRRHRL